MSIVTENIDQMRERHKQEIAALQKKCRHKKLSGWAELYWAVAHGTGTMVKTCNFCGKIIRRKGMKLKPVSYYKPIRKEMELKNEKKD